MVVTVCNVHAFFHGYQDSIALLSNKITNAIEATVPANGIIIWKIVLRTQTLLVANFTFYRIECNDEVRPSSIRYIETHDHREKILDTLRASATV